MARVADYGGQFAVPIEAVLRNNVSAWDTQTIQLANTLTRKLVQLAVAAVEAANPQSVAVPLPWSQIVTVGPLTDLTPSNSLPTANRAGRRNSPTSTSSASSSTPC
ncbi:hypothetical protein A5656_27985 [Mycobacterium gordonae]|nr:hypothetical protein [Mycobacterium gordonae]OBJ76033.1 hypothetical protein A9W97_08380 [Mycobacterium gordonae]OBK49857.1 hypothetical protein A5656_27985 [Mycobacterium gordonae]